MNVCSPDVSASIFPEWRSPRELVACVPHFQNALAEGQRNRNNSHSSPFEDAHLISTEKFHEDGKEIRWTLRSRCFTCNKPKPSSRTGHTPFTHRNIPHIDWRCLVLISRPCSADRFSLDSSEESLLRHVLRHSRNVSIDVRREESMGRPSCSVEWPALSWHFQDLEGDLARRFECFPRRLELKEETAVHLAASCADFYLSLINQNKVWCELDDDRNIRSSKGKNGEEMNSHEDPCAEISVEIVLSHSGERWWWEFDFDYHNWTSRRAETERRRLHHKNRRRWLPWREHLLRLRVRFLNHASVLDERLLQIDLSFWNLQNSVQSSDLPMLTVGRNRGWRARPFVIKVPGKLSSLNSAIQHDLDNRRPAGFSSLGEKCDLHRDEYFYTGEISSSAIRSVNRSNYFFSIRENNAFHPEGELLHMHRWSIQSSMAEQNRIGSGIDWAKSSAFARQRVSFCLPWAAFSIAWRSLSKRAMSGNRSSMVWTM